MEPRLAKVNGNVKVGLTTVHPDETIAPVTDALAASLELDADEMTFFLVGVAKNSDREVRKYLWRGEEDHLSAI
jgi:hypothetical protein